MRRVARRRGQSGGAGARSAATSARRSLVRSTHRSTSTEFPSGTVTFLLTDIEGSTARWEHHEQAMRDVIDRHDALLRQTITAHRGAVWKTMGDGFYAVFETAPDALSAALDIQRALRSESWSEVGGLRVRAVLMTGEAEWRDGDYSAPVVNRVSRLLDTAEGGQILIAGLTAELVRDSLPDGVSLSDLGEQRLRDLRRPIHVYEAVGEALLEQPHAQPEAKSTLLVFTLGGFRVESGGRVVADERWGRQVPGRFFKCLVSRPNRRLLTDQAFDWFWPGTDIDAAAKTLRSTVSRIRKALLGPDADRESGLIVSGHGALGVQPDAEIWVDADAFEEIIARARQSHDPQPLLEEADRLYVAHYLPDDLYEDWAGPRRQALKRLWFGLQMDLAKHREAGGDAAGAIDALQRRFEDDPCDEPAACELMSLLARQGRRVNAISVYDRLAMALKDSLELEPSAATVELRRCIAAGEVPLASPIAAASGPLAETPRSEPQLARNIPVIDAPPDPFSPSYPFPRPGQLVGRRTELSVLEKALDRGRTSCQVVLVEASAGTGKSALAGALIRQATESGVLCLAGGAYEQQAMAPFGPIRDALADYLLAQPAERVRADLGDAALVLAEIIPELRYHAGLSDPSPVGGDSTRLFGALSACLRTLASRQPVLLCLEDLHVADERTIALLQYLVHQARRLPLTLACTYRTEEVTAGQPLARLLTVLVREGATLVRLSPLGYDETTRLISVLLDGPTSDQLSDLLYEATEGNPLFVEQLVLALREEGRVDRRGGVWHQIDRTPHGLPTIIRDVLGRRFERLSVRCYETLAMASVLGRTLDHAQLAACLPSLDEDELMDDLSEAAEAQILDSAPNGYAFTHALLREALYWGLVDPHRTRLHARAGEALEHLFADRASDRAAVLAHHFVNGGHSPEVRAKALRHSLEAGRRAAALSAHREALDHFLRLCELIDTDAGLVETQIRLEVLEGRASAESALGVWLPLIDTCRRVLALTDDPLRRARARGWIGHALQRTGDTMTAAQECDAALEELQHAPSHPEVATTRLGLLSDKAYLLFLQGRFTEQHAVGAEMLASAVELGLPRGIRWAHNIVAIGHMGRGQVDLALEHYRQALDVATRSNDLVDQAVMHSNLGTQYHYAGEFARARAELECAIQLCRAGAAEHRAINTTQRLGWVLLAEGDLSSALERAEQARALASDAHDRWAADCHDLLGAIFSLRAEWSKAASNFEEALRIRERGPHVVGRIESLLGLGLIRQHAGNWAAARMIFTEALQTAQSIDPSPWLVAARRHLGRLLYLIGEGEGLDLLAEALELVETMPRSIEYGPTLLRAVEARLWGDDTTSAARALERALRSGLTAELKVEALGVLTLDEYRADRRASAQKTIGAALALAEKLGAPRTLSISHRIAGVMAAADGDHAAAAAAFDQALRLARLAGTPYELAQVLFDYAGLSPLDPGQSDAMIQEARAIQEQLSAGPALGHIRRLEM